MNMRFCQQEAHQLIDYFYIRIQEHCNKQSRLACIKCLEQQLDSYQVCDFNKLIHINKFIENVNQRRLISNAIENNKQSIDLNQIVNLDSQQLNMIILALNDDLNQNMCQNGVNQKQLDYVGQFELKFPNGDYIYTQQISSDEKYLAFGNHQLTIINFQSLQKKLIAQQTNKLIKVYCNAGNRILQQGDINQEAKIIKQKSKILKFSHDSKYLYSISSSGLLSCYNVKKNFRRILSRKIYQETVNVMILKVVGNKFIIGCPRDKTIKLYSILYNKIILNLKMPNQIVALDYNIYNNMIFCSYNQNICIINRLDGKIILNQNKSKQVYELVCIAQNQLLSRQANSLTLWMVDFQNNQLDIIRTFITSDIIQFSSVCNNQRFIIINWDREVMLLNRNFSIILIIPNTVRSNQIYYTSQLESMNFIILPGGSQNIYLKLK